MYDLNSVTITASKVYTLRDAVMTTLRHGVIGDEHREELEALYGELTMMETECGPKGLRVSNR